MNNKPLVSVIIPTYNRRNIIGRSIESILNQTYANKEIIVVDDASTDGTKEYIMSQYGNAVIYVKNHGKKGPSGARNYGVQIAKGKFIAFQDSDDEWEASKLERQMEILLSHEEIKMVYCEIARYDGNTFLGTLPSPELPIEQKQGNLFSYLLLNPLISTQTMLMHKEAFLQVGGFNETLQALEDYEFSIRFANNYSIGFATDTFVKAYNSADSVNMRWKEMISTQTYILQKWFPEFETLNLLLKKINLIEIEADIYGHREFAISELKKIKQFSESQALYNLLNNILENETSADNNFKIEGRDGIVQIRDKMYKLHKQLAQEELWSADIKSSLNDVILWIKDYIKAFDSSLLQEAYAQLADIYGHIKNQREQLHAVNAIVDMCNLVLEYTKKHMFQCNICQNTVFFLPISPYYENMRRKHGFIYWDAEFQLESKENHTCPFCKATDRDRLLAAFLDMLKPENNELLRMLQIAPSPSVEYYALKRKDIIYESTDLFMSGVTFQADLQNMDMVQDETYDIIVCSHVLEYVKNDAMAMGELYRMLKPKGVCLVVVPLVVGKQDTEEQWGCTEEENWRRFGQGDHARLYGKNDFIKRLQNAGFYINELGKDWFGEEFYRTYGFDDLSIMYVATKEIKLVE